MNCPECGSELLIGSEVCPVCDVISEEEKQKQKIEQQKKERNKKIVFFSVLSLVVVTVLLFGLSHISKRIIRGNFNGNSMNENLLVVNKGRYYYSTTDTLYSNNKNFTEPQIIDSTEGSITDLCFSNGSLYYIKNGTLCKYDPKTRKIKTLAKIEGDAAVAGYSEKAVFYNIGESFYMFSAQSETLEKVTDGKGIFCSGDLYVLHDNDLYEYNLKNKTGNKVCTLEKYTVPAYFKDGHIFCYNYKNLSMISIDKDTCEKIEVLKTDNFENISDITHLNIYKSYIFLRGESGIYRYNRENGDLVMLSSLGYMKYILLGDDVLYTVSHDNSAYFSDFDGRVKFTVKSNESN